MPIYLDASVIAALLFSEPASQQAASLLRRLDVRFQISDFTSAEVSSSISKRVRMRIDTAAQATIRLEALDQLKTSLGPPLLVDSDDIRIAEQLIRIFDLKLRAPDAIHAAVCLRHNHHLATLDFGLADAARSVGVAYINPAEDSAYRKTE